MKSLSDNMLRLGTKHCFIGCMALILGISFGISNGAPGAIASDYKVVDTGQMNCYGNSAPIPCSSSGGSFYGQDAQYPGNGS